MRPSPLLFDQPFSRLAKITVTRLLAIVNALALILLVSVAPAPAQTANSYRANTVLVMPNPGVTLAQIQAVCQKCNLTIKQTLTAGNLTTYVIDTSAAGMDCPCVQGMLSKYAEVQNVQMDYVALISDEGGDRDRDRDRRFPNDPAYPSQYELRKIRTKGAWQHHATGDGVTVAVLDTGCNPVTDLSGAKLATGWNAYLYSITYGQQTGPGNTDTDPGPIGHGTAIATTLAAITNNRNATASPAYKATIYPIIISDPVLAQAFDSSIIDALLQCNYLGIKLVNLSFQGQPGNTYTNQSAHPILYQYLQWFHDQGGLVFNSAGNAATVINDPRTTSLIEISSTDSNDQLASFSNSGTAMWFSTPGVMTQCSNKADQLISVSGTSASCPLATSVAAMVWSRFPRLTNDQVLERMKRTARRDFCGYSQSNNGFGIPNARRATRSDDDDDRDDDDGGDR